MCDAAPLEFCDVILGKPYMWKRHALYESILHSVIITLEKEREKILETLSSTSMSMITTKQWKKVISHTGKLSLFIIVYEGDHHTTRTSTPFA